LNDDRPASPPERQDPVRFDQACRRRELDVAELLAAALEMTLTSAGGKGNVGKRRELGPVVEAYSRLRRMPKDPG
jgi:hypothetical protein